MNTVLLLLLLVATACPRHVRWPQLTVTRLIAEGIVNTAKLPEDAYQGYGTKMRSNVIPTQSGPIQGTLEKSDRDGTGYAAYIGIPYAKPPVGQLRFQAPEPPTKWTNIFNATKQGGSCHHYEDCLYLNVFTPVITPGPIPNPKAVMVYIHGGAFVGGSKDGNQPSFFMDKDVVFVTINYRLGVLGFLSLQNEKVPGNNGLKDQLLALRWVKDNIELFGGDSNRITIFGQSAGAASVSYLQLRPETKGLFHGAICESGTAMGPWSFAEPKWALSHAHILGGLVGCGLENTIDALYDCLMEADFDAMGAAQAMTLTVEEIDHFHVLAFVPTLEPDVPGAVFTTRPEDALTTGDFNHVPMILGVNSREGTMIYPILKALDPTGILTSILGGDLSRFVPYELNIRANETQAEEISERFRDFYFDGGQVNLAHRFDLLDLITDSHFAVDIQKVTNLIAQNSREPVWNYRFTYEGPFNGGKLDPITSHVPGATHSDELAYLMDYEGLQGLYHSYERTSRPQLMIDEMVEMWTNFAKYGNPTPNTDGYVNKIWEPFTVDSHYFLELGEELQVSKGLTSTRMKFWNDIYDNLSSKRPLPE